MKIILEKKGHRKILTNHSLTLMHNDSGEWESFDHTEFGVWYKDDVVYSVAEDDAQVGWKIINMGE